MQWVIWMYKSEVIKRAFNLLEAEYGVQSEHKKEVWAVILKEYPSESIRQATAKYLKSGRFFPFVSDIIKIIEGDHIGEAEKVWSDLIKDINLIGFYGTPEKWKDNPIVNEVIEIFGGWESMCEIKSDEAKWTRKEFLKIYEAKFREATLRKPKEIENNNLIDIERLEEITKQIGKAF